MQTADKQQSSDIKQPAPKKIYRKPSIQVYGTLRQITSGSNTPGHVADGGGPAVSNRT
jgi:hypothetical protein